MKTTKICTKCKQEKSLLEFRIRVRLEIKNPTKVYYFSRCNSCQTNDHREYVNKIGNEHFAKYNTDRAHRLGLKIPMDQNKTCGPYLGVYIAERILSRYFEDIIRMPYGNPGYDLICKNGYKIDVKSSCIRSIDRWPSWSFHIRENSIADYFLCLAFDNREDLEPMHIWLIPSKDISHLTGINIPASKYGIAKWKLYERPLDKVLDCCTAVRQQIYINSVISNKPDTINKTCDS